MDNQILKRSKKPRSKIWIEGSYNFLRNRRGGLNLIYKGYLYTVERKYYNSVNWVCNKNSNTQLKCPARCVTSKSNGIRLSQREHNHDPIYTEV